LSASTPTCSTTVYLQQNAFDDIDGATPAERQQFAFDKLMEAVDIEYDFTDKTRLANDHQAPGYLPQLELRGDRLGLNTKNWLNQIDSFIATKGRDA
jgi:hypothetical protein